MSQWVKMRAQSHISICVSPPCLLHRRLYTDVCRYVRAGFYNVRVTETYFHTGDQRCHQTTRMLMTAMTSWILLARHRNKVTKMTSRAQADLSYRFCFL